MNRTSRTVALITVACLLTSAAALTGSASAGKPSASPFFTDKGPSTIPGELVVRFKKHVSTAASSALKKASKISATLMEFGPEDEQHCQLLRLSEGASSERAIDVLKSSCLVDYVQQNSAMSLCFDPNDPGYVNQYSLDNNGQAGGTNGADINARRGWDIERGMSNPVTVAVIDSGADYSHPDLTASMWTNEHEVSGNAIDDDGNGFVDDTRGWDFYSNDPDPLDDNGHGTHVSGIIAAKQNNAEGIAGVSDGAKVMNLKAFNASGSGSGALAAAATYYAVDNGASIINMSFCSPSCYQPLQDAINYAHARNVMVLAASGNTGDSELQYPASGANVVSVGATDKNDQWATFSTYNASVDVVAPGAAIYSLMPTYDVWLNAYVNPDTGIGFAHHMDYMSGTSMACPMAAGEAALIRSRAPAGVPDMVEQLMKDFADDDVSVPGRDDKYGSGRIDLYDSLNITDWPELYSISVSSGTVGTAVTMSGTDFGVTKGTSSVGFGTVAASESDYLLWSERSIQVKVPLGASGTVQVAVTRAGQQSNPFTFKVIPRIESILPASGNQGSSVTISGSGFGTTGTLYFGTVAANPTSWSDTAVIATVPAGAAGASAVKVVNAAGTSNSVTYKVVPRLTSLNRSYCNQGQTVVLTGTGFGTKTASSKVYFGTVAAVTYGTWNDTTISAVCPAGAAGSFKIKTVTAGGTSNEVAFRVLPKIISYTPRSGPTGTTITLTGSGFGARSSASYVQLHFFMSPDPAFDEYVKVRSGIAPTWQDNKIVFKLPSSQGGNVVYVKVFTAGGGSNTVTFTRTN